MGRTESEQEELARLEAEVKEAKQNDFSDLKELATAKEEKRKKTQESGSIFRAGLVDRIVQGAGEALVDVPISIAQSALLESGDEAIAGIAGLAAPFTDRTYADIYKSTKQQVNEFVDQARERSPALTTIGDFASPNPIGKVSKLAKFFSGRTKKVIETVGKAQTEGSFFNRNIVNPAAQGAVVGFGSAQDMESSPINMAQGAVFGLGMHGLVSSIKPAFGAAGDIESNYLGFRGQPKIKDAIKGKDFIDLVNADLDSINEKGLLVKGSVFDPSQNRAVMQDGSIAEPSIMSDKLNQIESSIALKKAQVSARDHVAKMIDEGSPDVMDFDTGPEGQFFEKPGVMTKTDIENFDDNAINLIRQDIISEYRGDPKMIEHVNSVVDAEISRVVGDGEFTLKDIHNAKVALHKELANVYGKKKEPSSRQVAEQTVKKKMATMWKEMVNDVFVNGTPESRADHLIDPDATNAQLDNARIKEAGHAAVKDARRRLKERGDIKKQRSAKGKKERGAILQKAREVGENQESARQSRYAESNTKEARKNYDEIIAQRRKDASGSPIQRLNDTQHEIFRFQDHLDMDIQGKHYDEWGNAIQGTPSVRSLSLLTSVGKIISNPLAMTRAQVVRAYDRLPEYAQSPSEGSSVDDKIKWYNRLWLNKDNIQNVIIIGGGRVGAKIGEPTRREERKRLKARSKK